MPAAGDRHSVQSPSRSEFDYRLATNREPAPAAARADAEAAAVDALLDAGLTAHLEVDRSLLDRPAGDATVAAAATRVSLGGPTGGDRDPVLRVEPDDRAVTEALLGVDGSDPPPWRYRDIAKVAVVDGDTWCYYAEPNRTADPVLDGLDPDRRRAVGAAVADIPCTALVPQGVVEGWTVGDVAVELRFEGLRVDRADSDARWYDHTDLEGVVVDPDVSAVVLTWPSRRGRATTAVGRLAGGLLDRVRESPPRLLRPPDGESLATVADTYETLAERLCYEFTFRRQPGTVARL